MNYVYRDDVVFRPKAKREEGTALRSATQRKHYSVTRLLLNLVHDLRNSVAETMRIQ